MPYANTFTAHAGTASNTPTTVGVDTTGTTIIFVSVNWFSNITGVSDNKGNTYTLVATQANPATNNVSLYKSQANPTVGAGHTFTGTCSSSGFASIEVAGFSGGPLGTQDVLYSQASSGNTTTITSNAIIPSTDGSLIVSAICDLAETTSLSVDSGFTAVTHLTGGGRTGGLGYLVQGTAASVSPKWTNGAAQLNCLVTVCYGGAALPTSPNITAVLTANDSSKVIDDWASDTWTPGGNWTSRKLGTIATAAANGGTPLPQQVQNAFGPYCRLQGIRGGANPELGSTASNSGGYFTLPASVTTVRAVLALAVCNDITTTTYHGSPAGWQDLAGTTSFQMGSDSLTWKLGGGSTETCYENGNAVGGALTRKLGPVVYTLISPSNYRADNLGGNINLGISNATYGAIVLFNAVPTTGEIAGYVTAFYSAMGISGGTLRDKLIVFNGDSRFQAYAAGEVTDASMRVSGQVVRSVGAPYPDFVDDAVFGFTSAQTITVITNATAPTLTASTRTHKTACILIGRNDLGSGTAPATTLANIDTIIGQYTTAGCDRILLLTECDSATTAGVSQATFNANRATLNTGIRARASSKVVIIDLATQANMGPNGSFSNTTYFQADGIHWTQTGVTTVANFITANATGGLFATSTGSPVSPGMQMMQMFGMF